MNEAAAAAAAREERKWEKEEKEGGEEERGGFGQELRACCHDRATTRVVAAACLPGCEEPGPEIYLAWRTINRQINEKKANWKGGEGADCPAWCLEMVSGCFCSRSFLRNRFDCSVAKYKFTYVVKVVKDGKVSWVQAPAGQS